jgi:DNA-binding NtrC family response regulator
MNILIIDDEKTVTKTLGDSLRENGYAVTCLDNGSKALAVLSEKDYDCVITDIKMPGIGGIELLKVIKDKYNKTEVILITAYATVEQAVEAIKKGAYDYITKPFMNEEVVLLLDKIKKYKDLEKENLRLKGELEDKYRLNRLVGKSKKMQEVFDLIKTVSKTDSNILIIGESGTGKELVAQAVHENSTRKDMPLIKLSCAVFPENLLEDELFGHIKGAFTDAKQAKDGRFKLADGGSIFLDDIDDMTLRTQVKLLRVLQEKEFEMIGDTKTIKIDIRVIAATKKNLKNLVDEGKFREDLYYRLNVVPLCIPPLREHKEDILLLIEHFIEKYAKGKKYSLLPEAAEYLLSHNWPGNIRELENSVERAIALAGDKCELTRSDFLVKQADDNNGYHYSQDQTLKELLQKVEKEFIEKALRRASGEKGKTATMLGISRKTLWEKIKEYGIPDVT